MKDMHKKMWIKKEDYKDAWEDGAAAFFRHLERAAEMAIFVGTVLFARCGILGMAGRMLGKAIEDEGCLGMELVLGAAMIAGGIMLHVWAEIEEYGEGA